jgi:hypothetical protein
MWGDVDPNTITFEQISLWRSVLERKLKAIMEPHRDLQLPRPASRDDDTGPFRA